MYGKSQKMSRKCKVKRLKLFLGQEFCEIMILCRGIDFCGVLSLGCDRWLMSI